MRIRVLLVASVGFVLAGCGDPNGGVIKPVSNKPPMSQAAPPAASK